MARPFLPNNRAPLSKRAKAQAKNVGSSYAVAARVEMRKIKMKHPTKPGTVRISKKREKSILSSKHRATKAVMKSLARAKAKRIKDAYY